MAENDEKIITKPILVEVEINKKLKFQETLKKNKKKQSMKDIINEWIDLYLDNNLYSKDNILDYVTLSFQSLINSQQVDKKVHDIFIKQFSDNLLMFSPENVREALEKIKKAEDE